MHKVPISRENVKEFAKYKLRWQKLKNDVKQILGWSEWSRQNGVG